MAALRSADTAQETLFPELGTCFSTARGVTARASANSGMVIFGFLANLSRISISVFPEPFPEHFPEHFGELAAN